jgi:hypothetical protein
MNDIHGIIVKFDSDNDSKINLLEFKKHILLRCLQ